MDGDAVWGGTAVKCLACGEEINPGAPMLVEVRNEALNWLETWSGGAWHANQECLSAAYRVVNVPQ